MTDRYTWNKAFRERILALLLDPDWYARFGTLIIRPEFFELDQECNTAAALVKFYSSYNRPPFEDELLALFEDDSDAQDLIERLYCYEDEELDFARDQALQFAKEQALKHAILQGVKDIEGGILSKLQGLVEEALHVGEDLQDLGMDPAEDTSWVYDTLLEDKVPTGIFHLDQMLGGGLGAGELGVVMSGTNVGKTMLLVNFGYGAAGLPDRHNVLHVSMEAYEQEISRRYGARTIDWLKKDDDPTDYIIRFRKAKAVQMPGELRIKDYPTGVAAVQDLDSLMKRLRLRKWEPDVLLVDYPGEMRHERIGEPWQNMADTYGKLRALAYKWHIPVWGAAQTQRSALSKKIVNLDDIGESFKAAQRADVVLAICQTQAEEEEHQLRIFAAKVRSGRKGWMVQCHIDEDAHAVISERVISVSEYIEGLKEQQK